MRKPETHECRKERDRKTYNDAYYAKNKEWMIADAKAYRVALKSEILAAYGGPVCACCFEDNAKFLSIDHIDGGGNAHRKAIGVSAGHGFYAWLKVNNFPPGFRVLCYNCNFGRAKNDGICPHEEEIT